MTVSVVVPTRDRPTALAACLRALSEQVPPVDEIVVVDDGSLDSSAVARVVASVANARVIRAEGNGPAAARNRGVQAATGAWILFTDDDCRPEVTWAGALVDRLREGAAVAAGPTDVSTSARPPARAAQVITNHLVHESFDAATSSVGFAPTCNLGASSELLARLPFDETYPLAAGEDRDWCDRVAGTGQLVAWVPAAAVAHEPALTVRSFWNQQVRYGQGAHRFRSGATDSRSRPPVRFYAALVGRGFRGGVRVGLLVVLAQFATAVGIVRASRGAVRRG